MGMSASEVAAKWAKNFGASAESYKQGVTRVQGSPAQKAIAAQDRLVSGFVEAVQSGKWASKLGAVTEAQWKQACIEKGGAAIATAARLAESKVARSEAKWGPIRDSAVASLPARGDINQNFERSRQMGMKMHEASMRG